MRNILLVFLIFFGIIQSNLLFAQQFGIKAGIGFPSIYKADEVSYYRNRLNHESNPIFILSLRLNWHLAGNFYLAWEPGVIDISGKVTGLAVGLDSENHEIFRYEKYQLWNLENSVLFNYNIFRFKNILVNIYLGSGISWNISDNQKSGLSQPHINQYYTDYPYFDYVKPYINNSGFYLTTGINLQFRQFQLDIRYKKEYYDLGITNVGIHKYYLFSFLIGYAI